MSEIRVFHGTEQSLVDALNRGKDLFYAYRPNIARAIYTTNEKEATFWSGITFSKEKEFVTTWSIPSYLLLLIEQRENGVCTYLPKLTVENLNVLPTNFLSSSQFLRMEGIHDLDTAATAVQRGQVVFVHTPNEYYIGAEAVDTILARMRRDNNV